MEVRRSPTPRTTDPIRSIDRNYQRQLRGTRSSARTGGDALAPSGRIGRARDQLVGPPVGIAQFCCPSASGRQRARRHKSTSQLSRMIGDRPRRRYEGPRRTSAIEVMVTTAPLTPLRARRGRPRRLPPRRSRRAFGARRGRCRGRGRRGRPGHRVGASRVPLRRC